jgi:hypothetical protein
VLALLFVMLGMAALWWLQSRRKPVPLRRRFASHKGNAARRAVELGDDGSNDLLVSEMLRTNELQVWFLSEHLVVVPLITATA